MVGTVIYEYMHQILATYSTFSCMLKYAQAEYVYITVQMFGTRLQKLECYII